MICDVICQSLDIRQMDRLDYNSYFHLSLQNLTKIGIEVGALQMEGDPLALELVHLNLQT